MKATKESSFGKNKSFDVPFSSNEIFIIAEIGANHNGSLDQAIALVDSASNAGADAVKFQKRNPHFSIPESQKTELRATKEWGTLTYLDYRLKLEFGETQFEAIDRYCRQKNIFWFASAWDLPSIDFLKKFQIPLLKIPSACLTSRELLMAAKNTGLPLYLSTGMSSFESIEAAVSCLGERNLLLAHTTSTYPCPMDEINLRMISTLNQKFPNSIVGYSGHDLGFSASLGAIALGARFLERHFTLDHTATGTDHRFSLDPSEFNFLVNEVRSLHLALGDGVKKIYKSELPFMKKLRAEISPSLSSVSI